MKQRLMILGMLFLLLLSCNTVNRTPTEQNAENINPVGVTSQTTDSTLSTNTPMSPNATPASQIDWSSIPSSEIFDLDWADTSIFDAGLQPDAQHWLTDLPYASRYRMELSIPETADSISGKEEVVYTNQEDVSLNEIVFRLFPNINGGAIEVSNLHINGELAEVQLTNANSTLYVSLVNPLEPGESILIQMDFDIQVPLEMGGNYGLFGYFDDVLMLDVFSPMIPAYDEDGWYSEVPARNGDLTYNDASFYLVKVTAPKDFVIATSGVEIDRETGAGKQILTFSAAPARDFSVVGSRNFIVDSSTEKGVTVNSYGLPGMEEGMKLAKESALGAIRIFGQDIGEYEYVEFDIAATPMQAGGIEYPGMTWINNEFYDLDEIVNGTPAPIMLESVTAHETGHQWFYNAVGNDQSNNPWLDEALTQYITGLYYRDRYGQDAYQEVASSWRSRWNRVDHEYIPIGLPSSGYTSIEYGAIVYGRGPFFFEDLSEKMGEDVFSQFLKDYYDTYLWKVANTEGLKQMAEEYCQCDLTDLFEEWVYPSN